MNLYDYLKEPKLLKRMTTQPGEYLTPEQQLARVNQLRLKAKERRQTQLYD